MPPMSEGAAAEQREVGFLLIADMEGSTGSKSLLGDEGAFAALREHNRLIMEHCRKAEPVPGIVLNSLGDAVVAKFPIRPGGASRRPDDPLTGTDEASRREALASCLSAARAVVSAFEALSPIRRPDGTEFALRTKITLQSYDAFLYGRHEELAGLSEELVGPHIDAAFRISAVSWRLQVRTTERFVTELWRCSAAAPAEQRDAGELVRTAHIAREAGAARPRLIDGISVPLEFASSSVHLEYWITDAREIARLKGISDNQRVFLISFESPQELIARGEGRRLTIKVRQDHHAVILASVTLPDGRNDNWIEYVLEMLGDSSEGSRLESELTLFAAAKIYGEFDFFFRVSCIDDESLRRFFDAIHDERFGVDSVEVRSTVAERFYVNPGYERILESFAERPFDLVLTWFQRDPESDLFERFVDYMDAGAKAGVRPVEILEAGEVIHHKPVYSIFLCENLAAYAEFFANSGLNPTGCRSHIGQITRPGDARLRYSLMSGVYVSPRRPRPSSGS